jgi:hypothetical protein
MSDKTFDSSFKRLIATLIAEDSFPESVKDAQRMVADSLLLYVDNEPTSPSKLSQLGEQLHFLSIQADELESVFMNDRYVKHQSEGEAKFSLRPHVYSDLRASSPRGLDSSVGLFCRRYPDFTEAISMTPLEIENAIYSFLYKVMDENLSDLQKVADHTISAEPDKGAGQHFSSEERRAINAFLDWDNQEKDKLVFRIANLGLEYCLMTNRSSFDSLRSVGIAPKEFYLDTNIIYRAIGLNGDGRKSRIRYFLSKCRDTGQSLSISAFAEDEFFGSISFHLDRIRERSAVRPETFVINAVSDDIYNHYYHWKARNPRLGADMYLAHIRGEYEGLVEEYDISIVDTDRIPFKEESPEDSQTIHDYSRAIHHAKSKFDSDDAELLWHSPKKDAVDAKNVLLIEKLREGSSRSVAETAHFMVSTDHGLIEWDHSRSHRVPIAMLPSQWLTLLMTVSTRSTDDFAAFSSFIRIPEAVTGPTNIEIAAVLEAIGQVTEDPIAQQQLYRNLIEVKADKIFRSSKPEKILENAYQEAVRARDEEVRSLRDELSRGKDTVKTLEEGYQSSASTIRTLQESLQSTESRKAELEVMLRAIEERKTVSRRVRVGWLLIGLGVVCLTYLLLQLLGPAAAWNVPKSIGIWIDSIQSPNNQNSLMELNYFLSGGAAFTLPVIAWSKFLSADARAKAIAQVRKP